MKTVARWNPIRELAPFAFPDVESLFRDFPYVPMPFAGNVEPFPVMRMDVTENVDSYIVKTELPGMKKEDIAVSIEDRNVSIVAEAKREKEAKDGDKALRVERYFGSLSRMVTLPGDVDPAKADARYEDGVLTLMLPKAAGSESRKLTVH